MYDLDAMETFLDNLIKQDRISTPEQQKLNKWVSDIFNETVKHTTTCTKCINKRIAKLKKYIAQQRGEATTTRTATINDVPVNIVEAEHTEDVVVIEPKPKKK